MCCYISKHKYCVSTYTKKKYTAAAWVGLQHSMTLVSLQLPDACVLPALPVLSTTVAAAL